MRCSYTLSSLAQEGGSDGLGTDGRDVDVHCQGEPLLRPCFEASLGLKFRPQKTDRRTDDKQVQSNKARDTDRHGESSK